MTWVGFGDWLQFAAAAATIFATPWIVDTLKYLLRGRVVVEIQPSQGSIDQSTGWMIKAKNSTGNVNQKLFIYPAKKNAKIIPSETRMLDGDKEAKLLFSEKYLQIDANFWPADRPLTFRIQFDRPSAPIFRAPSSSVSQKFVFRRGVSVTRQGMLIVAQTRLALLATQFAALAALSVGRLIWIGFTG